MQHNDGIDEELHKALQVAMSVVAQNAEKFARAREKALREAAHLSIEQAKQHDTARALMAANVQQVFHEGWWTQANENAICSMAEMVGQWAPHDELAGRAMGVMHEQVLLRTGVDMSEYTPAQLHDFLATSERMQEAKRRHEAAVLLAQQQRLHQQEQQRLAAEAGLGPQPLTDGQRKLLTDMKVDLTGADLTKDQAHSLINAVKAKDERSIQEVLAKAGQDPKIRASKTLEAPKQASPMSAQQAQYLHGLKIDVGDRALTTSQASALINAGKSKDSEQVAKLLAQFAATPEQQRADSPQAATATVEPLSDAQRGVLVKGGLDLEGLNLTKQQGIGIVGAVIDGDKARANELLTQARVEQAAARSEQAQADSVQAVAAEASERFTDLSNATVIDLGDPRDDAAYLAALDAELDQQYGHEPAAIERSRPRESVAAAEKEVDRQRGKAQTAKDRAKAHESRAADYWDSAERRQVLAEHVRTVASGDERAIETRLAVDKAQGRPASDIRPPGRVRSTPKPKGQRTAQRGTERERGR